MSLYLYLYMIEYTTKKFVFLKVLKMNQAKYGLSKKT